MKVATTVVHAGAQAEKTTGAVVPPIFQTSTYAQLGPGEHLGYDYARAGNPTREHYEQALAAVEGSSFAYSFSSGLAAESAILQSLLQAGDEVIVCDDLYGGSGRLFRTLFAKFNVKFHFLDFSDEQALKNAKNAQTKMIWVETPSNPMMKIIDIAKIKQMFQNCILVVDNTFASPIFQRPLSLGADLVLYSTTKYIGGHSDLIGGAVCVSNTALAEKIRYVQFAQGAIPSPFECFLLHRSLKTLAVRMNKHQENALKIVEFLESAPKVKKVLFPGLSSPLPPHQMSGVSGMISIVLDSSIEGVKSFFKRLKVFTLAESLGGVESLVNHPLSMTHASVPPELRTKLGITESLIRLSVGIEDAQDLVDDLKDALSAV